jgi:hypothetical protein
MPVTIPINSRTNIKQRTQADAGVPIGTRAYPTVFLSPGGFGDVTTFAAALAALPSAGGVILLIDAITVNVTVTVPANVKILGRAQNAICTMGALGTFVFSGARSSIADMYFKTVNNITMVDVNGGTYFYAENCRFDEPPLGSAIGVRLRASGCHIELCEFNGVLAPSTSTGIQYDLGFSDNSDSHSKWTT